MRILLPRYLKIPNQNQLSIIYTQLLTPDFVQLVTFQWGDHTMKIHFPYPAPYAYVDMHLPTFLYREMKVIYLKQLHIYSTYKV